MLKFAGRPTHLGNIATFPLHTSLSDHFVAVAGAVVAVAVVAFVHC